MNGNLYLYAKLIFVLYDTGTFISIISTRLVRELNLDVTTLPQLYMIRIARNEIMFSHHIVKDYVIRQNQLEEKANLIILETSGYDMILGMN